MKILDVKQGSPEWLKARFGVVTASELDALVSPTGKVRTGSGPAGYLAKKVAEAWLGRPLTSFSGSGAMEQGTLMEPEARPWFELEHNCEIREVGFIVSDDGRSGCSPDGLICDDRGIEIKCPQESTQARYLLAGELPDEYRMQVQGSMFVTGFSRWEFLSYSRSLPPLHVTVMRDERIMEAIANALAVFDVLFDEAFEKLNKASGESRKNPFACGSKGITACSPTKPSQPAAREGGPNGT